MKENYQNLEFEVIRFKTEDIITTSDMNQQPPTRPEPEPEPDPTGRETVTYLDDQQTMK